MPKNMIYSTRNESSSGGFGTRLVYSSKWQIQDGDGGQIY